MSDPSIDVGSEAPDFALESDRGEVRLSNLLASQHVVLYFVRAFT